VLVLEVDVIFLVLLGREGQGVLVEMIFLVLLGERQGVLLVEMIYSFTGR